MLGTVLSIDPGLRKCGCALWSPDGTLLRAWTARARG
jgi:RNase H-fold protein (predicted Holliday junction resolvase)